MKNTFKIFWNSLHIFIAETCKHDYQCPGDQMCIDGICGGNILSIVSNILKDYFPVGMVEDGDSIC